MEQLEAQVNNSKIIYYKVGEGEPLLILHGWGANAQTMRSVADALKDIRSCVLVDLPGFGNSPEPPKPWSVDDYTDAVIQLVAELGFKKIDLLVHSFGGRITLKLLSRKSLPFEVGKVLITGGAGMKPKRPLKYYLKSYTAKTLKAPFMILPGKLRDHSLQWLRTTPAWKALGSSDYQNLSEVMRITFVKTVTEYLESCLPKIDHEVFLLWGKNDDATPLYQAERMKEGLKNSTLISIENAGHYAFLDQPQQFKAIARAYFSAD